MVPLMRRALPVVLGRPMKSSRATVLMASMPRTRPSTSEGDRHRAPQDRMRDKYRDTQTIDTTVRLKTSEELRIEIRKDILELQAQGYDPRIIEDDDAPALPAPKRGNGSNGHG
jgi:hypothetical protein